MSHERNPELASKLAHLLSDIVTAKFILHGYHWNVLGPDFGQYHEFFSTVYQSVDDSIDPLAESILKAGYPAPYLLTDYVELTSIKEDRLDGSSPTFMLQSAKRVNDKLLDALLSVLKEAEMCDEQGLMDLIAGRIDIHKTFNWQIKAFLGLR